MRVPSSESGQAGETTPIAEVASEPFTRVDDRKQAVAHAVRSQIDQVIAAFLTPRHPEAFA